MTEKNDARIGLWLPGELLAKLKKRGNVSEEIRRRLERTLEEDEADPRRRKLAADPQTRELLAAIVRLAGLVQIDSTVPWHSDDRAFKTFSDAVLDTLNEYKPNRKIGPVQTLFGNYEADAEVIGRRLAQLDRHQHPEEYDHQRTAQRARQRGPALSISSKAVFKKGDDNDKA